MSTPVPEDEMEVRDQLRALRVDPPASDFEASLHRRLAAAGLPEEPGFWERVRLGFQTPWVWPAVGIAAGLVVVLTLELGRAPVAPSPVSVAHRDAAQAVEGAATQMPASKVAIVRLNLTTEVAADNAEIRVNLPEGLVFWSHGAALAQRSFSWTQALSAGENEIPIAIRGSRPGRYHVAVTAQTGSEEVEDEVILEVTNG